MDVLVTIYNTIRPEKPIKKFADRATAQEKMRGVLEVLAKDGPTPAVVGEITPKGERAARAPRDPNAPVRVRGQKNGNWIIQFISKENPRKAGTSGHRSRELAREGMTVDEFIAAGGIRRDLDWDVDKGWTKIVEPSGASSAQPQEAAPVPVPVPEEVVATDVKTGTDAADVAPKAAKKGSAKEQAARRSAKRK
jgi:hypothetical protein